MKKGLLTLVLILMVGTLFGYEWEKEGITVTGTTNAEDKFTQFLQDGKGNGFSVTYSGDINEVLAKKIIDLKDVFFNWRASKVETVKVAVKESTIEIIVIPQSMEVDGMEVASFIPAGMLFYYEDAKLNYDFRMMKDMVFVRINGLYINETELLNKISSAAKNPNAYIQRNDPDYYHAKFQNLDRMIEELQQEIFMLKLALVNVQNRGFFGKMYPVNRDVVDRVLALKKKNIKLTREEIEKQLTADKVQFGRKDVKLILAVFFNEFE